MQTKSKQTKNGKRTAHRAIGGEQLEQEIIQRLKQEQVAYRRESFEMGRKVALKFMQCSSYKEIKSAVEACERYSEMGDESPYWPNDMNHSWYQDMEGYDMEECFRGFSDYLTELFEEV